MAFTTSLVAALLLALSAPAAAGPPTSIAGVQACINQRIAASAGAFPGSATCPAVCAHCHEAPPASTCPQHCKDAKVFCACSGVMFEALGAAKTCCTGLSGLLLLGCSAGVGELDAFAQREYAHRCVGKEPQGKVSWNILSGLSTKAAASAALQTDVAVDRSAAGSYVGFHRMGAACVSLLEGIEREQASVAEQRGELGEFPDLRAAAAQIADRASGMLGAELPALKGKVHTAMTVAWSEEGPGLTADGICEVILKHHDSL